MQIMIYSDSIKAQLLRKFTLNMNTLEINQCKKTNSLVNVYAKKMHFKKTTKLNYEQMQQHISNWCNAFKIYSLDISDVSLAIYSNFQAHNDQNHSL